MKKLVFFAAASIFTASVFASPVISNVGVKIHPQETAKPVKEKKETAKPVKGKKKKLQAVKGNKETAKPAEAPAVKKDVKTK